MRKVIRGCVHTGTLRHWLSGRLVEVVRAEGWLPPAEVQERIDREGHCCDRAGG